ncbi:hypothetical protein C2E21_7801 [Chlorella sorokiniana]|uniref:Uncharacterized protein n=1 Tax=Chlorella sorokiniana TaxID=3076 RepID=A0A2P6TGA7_CHLSO|nr:hypothetical protein C2E21_7801 [Chlorella sorokiniana]|eukprot:PRW33146.1 hypothetical protein C2E21_7801 [Chlorella sorokiniana]
MPAAPDLPGSPSQPFHYRANLYYSRAGAWGDILLLGVHLAFAFRGKQPGVDSTTAAWQLATCAGIAASILWRLLLPAQHASWREALALALRLTGLGLGLGVQHVWQLVHTEGVPGLPSAAASSLKGEDASAALGIVAAQMARLVFVSCAGSLVMLALTLRIRLSLSALAQASLVATLLPHTRAGCAGPLMSHPAVQRATHRIYGMLSWVGTPLPLPLAPMVAPTPAEQCAVIVTFYQVALGLLLPLLWEAVTSARAFAAHQRQRRAAGLPPERGLQAWVYRQVWELCGNTEGGLTVPPALLAWILLAVAWDWTAFLTASSH